MQNASHTARWLTRSGSFAGRRHKARLDEFLQYVSGDSQALLLEVLLEMP